jgi:hypothetical protein
MATATLNLHSGGEEVTKDSLLALPLPPPTDTWFPISHYEVVTNVEKTLQGAGFQITESKYALSHENHRFFGTLDLTTKITDGITLAVGIRNSTDKSFPIGWCCGTRVFVCSNLSFTSEIVVSKKHTRFGRDRYLEGISRAVSGLEQYRANSADWISRLSHWNLSEDAANSYILQAYERDIVGPRLLPQIIKEWREPQYEEYRPRTAWSLWNAFTSVLGRTKQLTQPAQAAHTTIRLQGLLQEPIDVESNPVPQRDEEGS